MSTNALQYRSAQPTLMGIPAELRLQIYYHLVPSRSTLEFKRMYRQMMSRCVAPTKYDWSVGVTKPKKGQPILCQRLNEWPEILPLMLVNRTVCRDVQGIFYGENGFLFDIASYNWVPAHRLSSRNLGVFEPFEAINQPCHKSILRHLRRIHLRFEISGDYWQFRRSQARLRYFVEAFNELAQDEDEARRPQLTRLDIRISLGGRYEAPAVPRLHLFVCEGLVGLRGIARVNVSPGLAFNFPPCLFFRTLEFYIEGKGGELEPMEYPTKRIRGRAKHAGHRSKKVTVEDKKWWEPRYDWQGFARRNGFLEEDSGLGSGSDSTEVAVWSHVL